MGSLIPGLIAEAVFQRIEAIFFQTFTLKFWNRFVDDTFVIIDTDKLSDFHMALNNALPVIQFAPDKQDEINFPFLDILIHRLPKGTLETSVYRKSTHSDVVLHFLSTSPVSHNPNCIKVHFSRLRTNCSTFLSWKAEKAYL